MHLFRKAVIFFSFFNELFENKRNFVKVVFDCTLLKEKYRVSEDGVEIFADKEVEILFPVFEFDGRDFTEITIGENEIKVEYENSICRYIFEGKVHDDFDRYYNRNGCYRVYKLKSNKIKIVIEEREEKYV